MKTAMEQLIEHIQNNATKFSLMNTYNILKEIEPYLETEKEQAIDLIKETAMFVSAADIDKDIAKLTYEDIYTLFYKQNK